MKKIFSVLALALLLSVSLPVSAQKGMSQIGASFTGRYDTKYSKFVYGPEIKYAYNISDRDRVVGFASIAFGMEKMEFQVGVDNHWFIMAPQKVRPYLIGGAAYGFLQYKYEMVDYNNQTYYDLQRYPACVLKGGIGLDVRLTQYLALQFEATVSGAFSTEGYKSFYIQNNYLYYEREVAQLLGPSIKVGLAYSF